jgi:hypothetical protein
MNELKEKCTYDNKYNIHLLGDVISSKFYNIKDNKLKKIPDTYFHTNNKYLLFIHQIKDFMDLIDKNFFQVYYCYGIFVMSRQLHVQITEKLKKFKLYNIHLEFIYHPIVNVENVKQEFTLTDSNVSSEGRKLFMYGAPWTKNYEFLKNITDFTIDYVVFFEKWVGKIDKDGEHSKNINFIENFDHTNDKLVDYLTHHICIMIQNKEYSGCSSSLLQCIKFCTPVLTTKNDTTIDYLGEDYPFYLSGEGGDINEEIRIKINDNKLILQTSEFLRKLKTQYNMTNFINNLQQSQIISSLVTTNPQTVQLFGIHGSNINYLFEILSSNNKFNPIVDFNNVINGHLYNNVDVLWNIKQNKEALDKQFNLFLFLDFRNWTQSFANKYNIKKHNYVSLYKVKKYYIKNKCSCITFDEIESKPCFEHDVYDNILMDSAENLFEFWINKMYDLLNVVQFLDNTYIVLENDNILTNCQQMFYAEFSQNTYFSEHENYVNSLDIPSQYEEQITEITQLIDNINVGLVNNDTKNSIKQLLLDNNVQLIQDITEKRDVECYDKEIQIINLIKKNKWFNVVCHIDNLTVRNHLSQKNNGMVFIEYINRYNMIKDKDPSLILTFTSLLKNAVRCINKNQKADTIHLPFLEQDFRPQNVFSPVMFKTRKNLIIFNNNNSDEFPKDLSTIKNVQYNTKTIVFKNSIAYFGKIDLDTLDLVYSLVTCIYFCVPILIEQNNISKQYLGIHYPLYGVKTIPTDEQILQTHKYLTLHKNLFSQQAFVNHLYYLKRKYKINF